MFVDVISLTNVEAGDTLVVSVSVSVGLGGSLSVECRLPNSRIDLERTGDRED